MTIIEQMKSSHLDADDEVQEVLRFQASKFLRPENRYPFQVFQRFRDAFTEKGLERAKELQEEYLSARNIVAEPTPGRASVQVICSSVRALVVDEAQIEKEDARKPAAFAKEDPSPMRSAQAIETYMELRAPLFERAAMRELDRRRAGRSARG